MKITKSHLKQIILEELNYVLNEGAITNAWRRAQPGYVNSEDKYRALQLAKAEDDWKDDSYDHDPLRDAETALRTRGFGPDDPELIELAKELALKAGEEDKITYDWRDYIEEAKEELLALGVNR